jgi:hypothetical protein
MSRVDSYDGILLDQNSDLPLFISQPIDNSHEIAYIIVSTIMALPIIITDLYFAYNDETCVNYPSGHMNVKLKNYLIVSGYVGILGIVGSIICLYYESLIFRQKLVPVLKRIYILFNLTWTIIGSILYWGMMDNTICNKNIYTYMSSLLILKFLWFAHTLTKQLFM